MAWNTSFCKLHSFSSRNHCCGHFEFAHCLGMTCLNLTAAALIWCLNHLRCEYTLWSVNGSLCCSTSIPYLDIIALIRRIKPISSRQTDIDVLVRAESLSNDMSAVYLARLFSRCDLPDGLPVDLSHLVISSALMLSLLSTFIRYLLNETLAHICFFSPPYWKMRLKCTAFKEETYTRRSSCPWDWHVQLGTRNSTAAWIHQRSVP